MRRATGRAEVARRIESRLALRVMRRDSPPHVSICSGGKASGDRGSKSMEAGSCQPSIREPIDKMSIEEAAKYHPSTSAAATLSRQREAHTLQE